MCLASYAAVLGRCGRASKRETRVSVGGDIERLAGGCLGQPFDYGFQLVNADFQIRFLANCRIVDNTLAYALATVFGAFSTQLCCIRSPCTFYFATATLFLSMMCSSEAEGITDILGKNVFLSA